MYGKQQILFQEHAVSVDRMRTYEEAPWLSLLPRDERAALEVVKADPEAEEWDALVAADRALEHDVTRPSRSTRVLVPLAAGGLVAAILLVLDPSAGADRSPAGASDPTASSEVAAVYEVPERNRAVLASRPATGVAGATSSGKRSAVSGRRPESKKPSPAAGRGGGGGGGGGGSQPPPPGSTPPPGGQISIPSVQLPPVEVPPVAVPSVPGVQLPPVQVPPVALPPVQLPPVQVPQLPPLLPPPGR